jgi:hypothetical protein
VATTHERNGHEQAGAGKTPAKAALLLTVSLMGRSTFLVGCLPTYADIGIWAPVLLVPCGCCRASRRPGSNRAPTR